MKKIIGLFPGQGAQSVGMGRELAKCFALYRQTLEEGSEALGWDLQKLCFEDSEKQLSLTQFTQPALLATSVAAARVLKQEAGVSFSVYAGHSLGEYSALCAAGALSLSDALRAVHFRGQAMQRAVPVGTGAMAAFLGAATADVENLCCEMSNPDGVVEVVNFNCPGQVVLSGHKEAVDKITGIIKEKKLGKCIPLSVSAPFHSSLMVPAALEMKQYLKDVNFHDWAGEIVANVDGAVHTSQTYTKDLLVRQLASPVLWTQSLHKMKSLVDDDPENVIFVEVGHGKVLQGLLKKTWGEATGLGSADPEIMQKTIAEIKNEGE